MAKSKKPIVVIKQNTEFDEVLQALLKKATFVQTDGPIVTNITPKKKPTKKRE